MSFPNPAMLPFFAAGGAISGSSFGLFYTILMQIGYNFYGKRALKELEAGKPLFQVLMDIQKEIQPFSDQMMQTALDTMPDVLDKTIEMFSNLGEHLTTGEHKENLDENLATLKSHFGFGAGPQFLGGINLFHASETEKNKLLPPNFTGPEGETTVPKPTVDKNDEQKILALNLHKRTLGDLNVMLKMIAQGSRFGVSNVEKLTGAVLKWRNARQKQVSDKTNIVDVHRPDILPPSKYITPVTRVSKQTLQLEKVRLVNAVASEARVLKNMKAKLKQYPNNKYWTTQYNKQLGVFKAIQSKLYNFLQKWSGKF